MSNGVEYAGRCEKFSLRCAREHQHLVRAIRSAKEMEEERRGAKSSSDAGTRTTPTPPDSSSSCAEGTPVPVA